MHFIPEEDLEPLLEEQENILPKIAKSKKYKNE